MCPTWQEALGRPLQLRHLGLPKRVWMRVWLLVLVLLSLLQLDLPLLALPLHLEEELRAVLTWLRRSASET